MNKIFFILSVLCFTVFYSTFAVAVYTPDEKRAFEDLPLAEDIGIDLSVPLSPEDMTGVISNKEEKGEEIQLANGGYGHGYVPGHVYGHGHGHGYLPPVAPLFSLGNICRAGISYCYTSNWDIVGTICHCVGYDFWGFPYIRFHGAISQY